MLLGRWLFSVSVLVLTLRGGGSVEAVCVRVVCMVVCRIGSGWGGVGWCVVEGVNEILWSRVVGSVFGSLFR